MLLSELRLVVCRYTNLLLIMLFCFRVKHTLFRNKRYRQLAHLIILSHCTFKPYLTFKTNVKTMLI